MAEGGGFSNAFQFWWPNALLFDFHPSSPTALYHMQASLVITINQMDELKFSHYNAIYYYFFSALCRLPSSRGLHKVQKIIRWQLTRAYHLTRIIYKYLLITIEENVYRRRDHQFQTYLM